MAVTLVSAVTLTESPFWIRKLSISGVNAVDGTGETINHGFKKAPDMVWVATTVRAENAYEAPTTYIEVAASRTDTTLTITSEGTQSAVKADIYCVSFNWDNIPNSTNTQAIPSEPALPTS